MKSPQKRLVDMFTLQNSYFFKVINFTSVIEKKVIDNLGIYSSKSMCTRYFGYFQQLEVHPIIS